MRLIDADVFKAYMRGALEQTRRCYPDGGEWAEAVTEEFCRDIDEQPTVQPERKRGSWENDKDDLPRCSECGYIPEYNRYIDDYYYSDFYPNCGADMRGG